MQDIVTLLRPRWWSFKNRGKSVTRRKRRLQTFFFGSAGLFFWGGVFALSLRVLFYFRSIEDFGTLLAHKLLSMVLITFFSLLIFSNILTALSKLYLSRDLALVHSTPVSSYKIFLARWIESMLDSSWMVVVYTLPVFIAYGVVFHGSVFYYLCMLLVLPALSVIAAGISTLLVMTAVILVPASRIKNIFIFLSLSFFLILFFAIRMLRPERLVNPEVFDSALMYLKALRSPAPAYLPSTWAFDTLKAALTGAAGEALFHTALSWSFAALVAVVMVGVAARLYFPGMSKTQTAMKRLRKKPAAGGSAVKCLPPPLRALAVKEIKTFFRDQTQWPQLFLIAALVVIYVYNFDALPLEKAPIPTLYLQNLLAFLNVALAAFVLTAVAARFVYPALSLEGEAFWLIRSAPVSLTRLLWIKFSIYFVPLLVLSEILIVSTNILLDVTPFMMVLSTATIFLIVPGVVSLGIFLGAAYPDFKSENPAQSVTSFGGVLFMMICAGYIGTVIALQSGPVYRIFMAGVEGRPLRPLEWLWTGVCFALVLLLNVLTVIWPMRYGVRRLHRLLS